MGLLSDRPYDGTDKARLTIPSSCLYLTLRYLPSLLLLCTSIKKELRTMSAMIRLISLALVALVVALTTMTTTTAFTSVTVPNRAASTTQLFFFGQPKDDGSPGDYVCLVGS